jgi:hypothetical protein
MVIDNISFDAGGALGAIDLRFEERCGPTNPALHGKIHWTSNDPTQPAPPVNPPPANLWQPAPGATPASGNYLYLQSQPGDPIWRGATFTYVPPTASFAVTASGRGQIGISLRQIPDFWDGNFQVMDILSQVQPGYYPNLIDYGNYNPAFGGMMWSGNFRSCSPINGWMAVDAISYVNGVVTAIDMRFEQRCLAPSGVLNGKLHWVAP